VATKEQIRANRKNAKKSTGPKNTDRTRLNALKHGLRSDEVVLPTEDPQEFREFLDAWLADWNPPTMARRQLVEEAASAAWRKRRCLRVESARLSQRIEQARASWDRDREDDVDRLAEELVDEENTWPRGTVDALMASRRGVGRLIELWEHVAEAAAASWADADDHFLMIRLHGHLGGDDEVRTICDASWRLFLAEAPEEYEPGVDPEPWAPAEAEVARRVIVDLASSHLAALRELRPAVPDDAAARDAHAEVMAFAPRPEDAPLLRYEAQRSREFHRALADLVKLTKSGDDLVLEAEEAEAPSEAKSSEASSEERVKTEKPEPSSPAVGPERAVGGATPAREAVARPVGAAGALSGAPGSACCAA
jgi:hypothetical protein